MKNILQKWRGLAAAALLAVTTLPAAETPLVKTLGGGPNQTSIARAGSTDGQTFSFAKFKKPYAAALDSNGDLFIADFGNGRIRKVTKPGAADSLTSTFVSGLNSPSGVAIGASNIVYVVTQGDGRLRKYSSTGVLLETTGGFRAPTAVALSPTAVTLGTNGSVFITELNGNVYEVPLGDVPMLIGSGFRRPHGLAVLGNGLVAVTESSGHAVQLLDPSTGVATLLAGGNGAGFADGSAAKFNQPYGIALAPNGSLIVADKGNHRVRVIGVDNAVSTLYGVSKTSWVPPFPGWADGVGGPNGVAASRDPVGVTVGNNGIVYTTEIYWNLLRQVTSAGLGIGSGVNTNVVGTNSVVGTNIISWGFSSGIVSSSFIGAAGQHHYAPITLSLAPGQKIYTLQLGMIATNEGPTPLDFTAATFKTSIGVVTTNIGGIDFLGPLDPNYNFTNHSANLIGVGYITQFGETNYYNTRARDLIEENGEQGYTYGRERVVVGKLKFDIPANATENDSYLLTLLRPSATSDGIHDEVSFRVPTDGSLQRGALNGVKRVTLASRLYVVGDCGPFRYYNAGDFGDGYLVNGDVIQVFTAAINLEMNPTNGVEKEIFPFNVPEFDSDLFNAMDSWDGSTNSIFSGDDLTINTPILGDGRLDNTDVFVTFRRSLDPTVKWYGRYWSNGALQVVEVPNVAQPGTQPGSSVMTGGSKSKSVAGSRPRADVTVPDTAANANELLQIPVHVNVSGGYPLRVMMASVVIEPLDGSPAITQAIQFQPALTFQTPELQKSYGPAHYAAAWLKPGILGVYGDATLAFLTVRVPGNVNPRTAYRVHFNHFSGSPNGLASFDSSVNNALILLSDRSGSTWNDGISDAWRLRYFGSIFSSDSAPGADADGDGVVNSVEYQNGSNPTDATSF
jgi:streptogramin lyase